MVGDVIASGLHDRIGSVDELFGGLMARLNNGVNVRGFLHPIILGQANDSGFEISHSLAKTDEGARILSGECPLVSMLCIGRRN